MCTRRRGRLHPHRTSHRSDTRVYTIPYNFHTHTNACTRCIMCILFSSGIMYCFGFHFFFLLLFVHDSCYLILDGKLVSTMDTRIDFTSCRANVPSCTRDENCDSIWWINSLNSIHFHKSTHQFVKIIQFSKDKSNHIMVIKSWNIK